MTLNQCFSCGEPETFYAVINGSVLLDVCIGLRYVCFGLVIVIIADEISHGVFREKCFELAVKLCG